MRRLVLLLLLATAALAADKEVKRDDGKREGRQSSAGTGHVIALDAPRGTWWIRSIRIHGARYGGGYDPATTKFLVSVCDDDLKPLTQTEAKYELFKPGRFEWVDVPLLEPVKAPRKFKVVVEFRPTGRKGVYVSWAKTKKTHSGYGTADGRERPYKAGAEWMIRARLSKKKPKAASKTKTKTPKKNTLLYTKDFEYLARTIRNRFPALKKKGLDWPAVVKQWRPRFRAAKDDKEHVTNAHRLLALLGDMHTGITRSKVQIHVPPFDGLYNAGLWIAADRGRLVLRAMAKGHKLEGQVKPGAELLTIGGRPAKLVHEETRHRCRTWSGWSSTHFLDARLSFQFFPFGEKKTLSATFLNTDGKVVATDLERWGPGGRGLSRIAATMPDGVTAQGGAVSARLDDEIGYIRILGGMNEKTRADFFQAFDQLKGLKAILLDCRGMGGGGDTPAWAMAGRFFKERSKHPRVKPTGDWQFNGTVVMLQDEREVSSAETFTWAMTETGRAYSVGRPTGGGTIIPTVFEVPSGLFQFRMGVSDRKTLLKGVQPEGIGTPPGVFVPYDPVLLARHADPTFAIGLEVLKHWMDSGMGHPPEPLKPFRNEFVKWQIKLCETKENPMPDFAGALARLAEWGAAPPAGWEKEAAAQRAWEALPFPPTKAAVRAFVKKHAGTRYAATMRTVSK